MDDWENKDRAYIAIDLKSFYASVECVERGLDPLTTNLVVADLTRTEKTICLAVSPSLKAYGIPGRARLFEVVQKVREINRMRRKGRKLNGKSVNDLELKRNPNLELDYIVATPRMGYYMEYSARIYNVYLKFVAPEDIFAYSIDEVFIDVTAYLKMYKMSVVELARKILKAVLDETGITATAGVGTNMYLAKVAMDILAKHVEPDADGARVVELDEMSYRRELWAHRPLTDFWRVGKGYARRLESAGLYTMGDIALCAERDEDYLYKMFGVNAELLIDHAWGWEPCTIKDVKAYRPRNNSFSSGQVLKEPYDFVRARVVAREMAEEMVLSLLARGLTTDQVVLTVGYDAANLLGRNDREVNLGEVTSDFYGRRVPKHAHGTYNLKRRTASAKMISGAVMNLFDELVGRKLLVRRITIEVCHVLPEGVDDGPRQLGLFEEGGVSEGLDKEKRTNEAVLDIKQKFGKNAILKGINFEEGATGRERNAQIGGHRK
ncbi:DNA methylase [Candidatus Saccharibacteria bacterium]|nr:DNA methylase [Candidatus Saccharibacteria bacterium]